MNRRGCRSPQHDGGVTIRDRGSGTVYAVGIVTLVAVLTVAALALGGAVIASHRARAAADLGALAGASSAGGPSCGSVERIVRRHHATVTRCSVQGPAVEVEVAVATVGPVAALGPARARARAGPDPPGPVSGTPAQVPRGPPPQG